MTDRTLNYYAAPPAPKSELGDEEYVQVSRALALLLLAILAFALALWCVCQRADSRTDDQDLGTLSGAIATGRAASRG